MRLTAVFGRLAKMPHSSTWAWGPLSTEMKTDEVTTLSRYICWCQGRVCADTDLVRAAFPGLWRQRAWSQDPRVRTGLDLSIDPSLAVMSIRSKSDGHWRRSETV